MVFSVMTEMEILVLKCFQKPVCLDGQQDAVVYVMTSALNCTYFFSHTHIKCEVDEIMRVANTHTHLYRRRFVAAFLCLSVYLCEQFKPK